MDTNLTVIESYPVSYVIARKKATRPVSRSLVV
jgi:hypothetical protein